MGALDLEDLSYLSGAKEIWEEWRFEPWSNGSAEGLRRRVSLIKSGLLGVLHFDNKRIIIVVAEKQR